MKIRIRTIRYFGYKQGYKVYINGKKYPLERGRFYTHMKRDSAVRHCLKYDYKPETPRRFEDFETDQDELINHAVIAGGDYYFHTGHRTGNIYLITWNHVRQTFDIPELGHHCNLWRVVLMAIWHYENKSAHDRFQMRVEAITSANEIQALFIKAHKFGQLDGDSNHQKVFALRCQIGRESVLPAKNAPENNANFDKMRAAQRAKLLQDVEFWDNQARIANYGAFRG